MSEDPRIVPDAPLLGPHQPLKRIEHYTLAFLNQMAAGGSAGLSDEDIDYAIDLAERVADRLRARGHIPPHG